MPSLARIELQYASPPTRPTGEVAAHLLVLKPVSIYFVVSIITITQLDVLWVGEIPVLALIQVPKINPAAWLCTHVVMPAIGGLGLSRGSFSPDYGLARPYALAIVYLAPLAILLPVIWARTRLCPPLRRWTLILLVAAIVDYAFTLLFASGRSLTIY